MEQATGRITISRTSPRDIRDRQVYVSIDGQRIGMLLFGQSVTTEREPGAHQLRAHNTLFWKTIDFDVAAGDDVRFVVVNRAGFGTYALLSLLGTGPLYLDVERER
jgi:hypothetical protein